MLESIPTSLQIQLSGQFPAGDWGWFRLFHGSVSGTVEDFVGEGREMSAGTTEMVVFSDFTSNLSRTRLPESDTTPFPELQLPNCIFHTQTV